MKPLKTLFMSLIALLLLGNTFVQAADTTVDKNKVVQNTAQQAYQQKQKKVVDDAAQGIQLTYQALTALRDDKIDEAKTNLVNASKAFDKAKTKDEELVTAGVFMDVVAGVEDVATASDLMTLAEEAISASNPQLARDLLSPLISEIDISETDIPIITYADNVNKAIASLEKNDKVKADEYLVEAIGSAVMVSEVIPIPTLFAEEDLNQASTLVNSDPEKALVLLQDAEEQITLNNILGYEQSDAFKQDYKSVRKKVLSAHHQQVWDNIKMKLGLIKKNNTQNTDKNTASKISKAVDKIEKKTSAQKTK